ncbi:MAG TPA: hypothetical protein VG370_27225 [Chloroflexota bacterium]|jgi:hypothetical protein|nr:hypothetical protein [Chloroflexota bacterium]
MPRIDDDARWAADLAERVAYFDRHLEAEAARRLERLAALGVDPRDHKYYQEAVYLDAGDGALAVPAVVARFP